MFRWIIATAVAILMIVVAVGLAVADGGCTDHDNNPLTPCVTAPPESITLDLRYHVEGDQCVGAFYTEQRWENRYSHFRVKNDGQLYLNHKNSVHTFREDGHISTWRHWQNLHMDPATVHGTGVRLGVSDDQLTTVQFTDRSYAPHALMAACNEILVQNRLTEEQRRQNVTEIAVMDAAEAKNLATQAGLAEREAAHTEHHAAANAAITGLLEVEAATFQLYKIVLRLKYQQDLQRAKALNDGYSQLSGDYSEEAAEHETLQAELDEILGQLRANMAVVQQAQQAATMTY